MAERSLQAAVTVSGSVAVPQGQPQAENRDNFEDVQINPVRRVVEEPVSTFSIDVDTASYAVVRRMLGEGVLPPRDAVRIEELINYFDYDYPAPKPGAKEPFSVNVAVVPSPWAEGRELLHVGIQGAKAVPEKRPPVNLTLLIDVSGSMSAPDKLPLAKQAFATMIEALDPKDTVAIAVYAGAAGEILPPTPVAEKGRILAALDSLSSGGSTAGGEGLRLAYALAERSFVKDGVNRVMLITDGDFNVGVTDIEQLEDLVARKRETGVYLSVFGVGQGNYNDALMQRIAQNGNGMAAYVDTVAEGRRLLVDDLSANLFPLADDVKIQVEFNPAEIAEYRLIGYETRMLAREDFNNDRVDAGEIGAGARVTAIYEIVRQGSPALQSDASRYQPTTAVPAGVKGELAYLKLRWKPPGEDESRLISRAVVTGDRVANLKAAPEAVRFATAVAGYGQLLRGDPYTAKGYDFDDVIALAQGASGADPFGMRAEFVQLARAAKTAAAQEALSDGTSPER
jgi:Ca-activated chloride channel family protein